MSKGKKVSEISAKVFVALLLCVAGFWTAKRIMRLSHDALYMGASPEKKFMLAWDDDVERLQKAHVWHDGMKHLHEMKLQTSSSKIKDAFQKYPLTNLQKTTGGYSLEIFADEIEGGGVVIQYDLVELKSGNTVWELGRTFPQSLAK